MCSEQSNIIMSNYLCETLHGQHHCSVSHILSIYTFTYGIVCACMQKITDFSYFFFNKICNIISTLIHYQYCNMMKICRISLYSVAMQNGMRMHKCMHVNRLLPSEPRDQLWAV